MHDLVLCSASFLNAEVKNTNTNQSFRGAGSYGDILIRDRRMYVCATPYALAAGTEGHATLILETGSVRVPDILEQVGEFQRAEADEMVTGYSFDLTRNKLECEKDVNPNAGRVRNFCAYKIRGFGAELVSWKQRTR